MDNRYGYRRDKEPDQRVSLPFAFLGTTRFVGSETAPPALSKKFLDQDHSIHVTVSNASEANDDFHSI